MLVLPYQGHWPLAYAKLITVLASCLRGLPVTFHHVGSTAVPGLAAKDIVDIDIAYHPSCTIEDITAQLATIGYQHHGDQGILHREVFKRITRTEDHLVLDQIPHHLYACPEGSRELLRHLRFRNHLRQHPADRETYALLKQSIAHQANYDKKVYANLKTTAARGFIEAILAGYPPIAS